MFLPVLKFYLSFFSSLFSVFGVDFFGRIFSGWKGNKIFLLTSRERLKVTVAETEGLVLLKECFMGRSESDEATIYSAALISWKRFPINFLKIGEIISNQ